MQALAINATLLFFPEPQTNHFEFINMGIQILLSILLALFSILFIILNKSKHSKLPPGPWKLPIIGNMHQFVGSLPHHVLKTMANKYGPIFHLQLGEISNVVISTPEIAKEVLKTHDEIFANRPQLHAAEIITYGYSNMGFSRYGSYWRQLRKICTLELLSAKRAQSFRSIRQEEVAEFIKDMAESEGSSYNLSQSLSKLISSIVARAAFGSKSKDGDAFLTNLDRIIKVMAGFSLVDIYPSIKVLPFILGTKAKAEKLRSENDRIFANIFRDHEEKSRVHDKEEEEDFVDVLLKIQQRKDLEVPLTSNSIKALFLDVFGGGTDSSSSIIQWTMSELMRNPKTMQKVQAEVRSVFGGKGYVDETEIHQLEYLNAVIKETFRLHPSDPLIVRTVDKESVEICGYHIPAKSRFIVNVWAMARDPKYWSEPEKFQPERFLDNPMDFKGSNLTFLPFGTGRRICPGIAFAMPNVELTLASMLYHFDWKLPNGMKPEELDMSEFFGAIMRRKNSLCLVPIRYCP